MKTIEEEMEENKSLHGVDIIKELIGKTFHNVENANDELLTFYANEADYRFFHEQDCCENVSINDICGDLSDLIDTPILIAEKVWREAIGEDNETNKAKREVSECGTWTFYKFATIKGHVTVRWLGESNGYYSEEVSFAKL